MELAFLLILLVLAELVVSVWMLSRHRQYLGRVKRLEDNVTKMAEVLADLAKDNSRVPQMPQGQSVSELVAQATPEDMEQARAILDALGFNKGE